MPIPTTPCHATRRPSLCLAAVLALSCATARAGEPDAGFSAGVSARSVASAADIGLPVYPGATPSPDRGEDSPGADLHLWGGAFGIRLQVLKLRTSDKVDAVARYYREAMTRQGSLVDCGADPVVEPVGGGKLLRCGSDRPPAGGRLYKLGFPGGVRIVAIEPYEGGSRIQMVRLLVRGE